MILYYENNTDYKFDFNETEIANLVINKILDEHNCNFEVSVNLYIENNETIQIINKDTRGIDKPTDVLSFPNIEFEKTGDFVFLEKETNNFDYFDPDDNSLILGEIIISYEKVKSQALEYGHSEKREYAFLIAHSMLHLLGYDHETENERIEMEDKQKDILNQLNITRD